jgi:hypothetical protein
MIHAQILPSEASANALSGLDSGGSDSASWRDHGSRGPHSWSKSRPAIERLIRLARLVRHSLPFTCGEMAAELEVSRKTIVRDLAFLRDRLGWDFYYDPSLGKYRCIKAPEPQL